MVQLASEAVSPTRAVRLIILDRDGVINHDSEQFIKSPDEWRAIPGSLEAIARLNQASAAALSFLLNASTPFTLRASADAGRFASAWSA